MEILAFSCYSQTLGASINTVLGRLGRRGTGGAGLDPSAPPEGEALVPGDNDAVAQDSGGLTNSLYRRVVLPAQRQMGSTVAGSAHCAVGQGAEEATWPSPRIIAICAVSAKGIRLK